MTEEKNEVTDTSGVRINLVSIRDVEGTQNWINLEHLVGVAPNQSGRAESEADTTDGNSDAEAVVEPTGSLVLLAGGFAIPVNGTPDEVIHGLRKALVDDEDADLA